MQVPAIQLDRPGMWAPKILQARARAQEATSLPRTPIDRAGAAQPSAVAEEPAAASLAAAPKHCQPIVEGLSDQGAESDLGLQRAAKASPVRASKAPVDVPSQQRGTSNSPERQLESRTDTAHPPALSPDPEHGTAAKAQPMALPADAAHLDTKGMPILRRVQSQPAKSAPLQGSHASDSKQRRRASAALGTRKALSAPLILPMPDLAGDDEVGTSAVHQTAAAETQGDVASVHVQAGSQWNQEAGAVREHAPETDPAPAAHEAAAADLMCSPFMQALALADGQIPSTKVLGDAPLLSAACDAGPEFPSGQIQSSSSLRSQSSQPAIVSWKLTPADRCMGGSVQLTKTQVRQLSKQSPALCLPPKKRLQKKCGRGTPPPSGGQPAAGQAFHADVPIADVSLCAAKQSSAAEPAKAHPFGTEPVNATAEKPAAAEDLPRAGGQVAHALPVASGKVSMADAPAAAAKPRRRPGRPPGSGKAARARALGLALPTCSPEGKRPLKKSRKALEAEQVSSCCGIIDVPNLSRPTALQTLSQVSALPVLMCSRGISSAGSLDNMYAET